MLKLTLDPSAIFSCCSERKSTEKSQSVSHETNNLKYFITGALDSDKIVRSFLSREEQLKWRLFSREIHENLEPVSVIRNRIYPQNKEKYFNVTSFLISPCGTYLFLAVINSSTNTSVLKMLDFNTQVVLKEFIIAPMYEEDGLDYIHITSITMIPCGKEIMIYVSCAKEKQIVRWNFEIHVDKTQKKPKSWNFRQGKSSRDRWASFDSNIVLSSCGTKYLYTSFMRLLIVDSIRRSVSLIDADIHPLPEISSFATSHCEKKLVIAFNSGVIKVFNFETKIENYHLALEGEPIDFIIISPCGEKFLTHSRNGLTKVFDLDTGAELYELAEKENLITSAAITPCGKKWITGLTNGFVKIWDFMTGTELCKFRIHEDQIKSLQVSPCGKKIIVLTSQHEIQTWSIEEKKFDPDDSNFIHWKREQNRDTGCFIQ